MKKGEHKGLGGNTKRRERKRAAHNASLRVRAHSKTCRSTDDRLKAEGELDRARNKSARSGHRRRKVQMVRCWVRGCSVRERESDVVREVGGAKYVDRMENIRQHWIAAHAK